MYRLLRPLLFALDPELSHAISMKTLKFMFNQGLLRQKIFDGQPLQKMGLTFPNRIGLAAGLDKNGEYIDALATLGFGFIEIGTVTPLPQSGQPKPRLFRLPKDQALINRMGFNSAGIDYVIQQLKQTKYKGVLGINIGKNKLTPNEKAIDDYLVGFQKLAPYASYITINVSSPNTKGLRELEQANRLSEVLITLKNAQQAFALQQKYVPLVVKISPDLSAQSVGELANVFLELKIDGVIATNTTVKRNHLIDKRYAHELGGLSGAPLQARSTAVIRQLHASLQDKIPIIGCGGILDAASAQEKFAAGASLLQVYTGLIYHGWRLINEMTKI